jgi:hypothetical protein
MLFTVFTGRSRRGWGNSDFARLRWMFEMLVAAGLTNFAIRQPQAAG